ncbi:unnamed protein product, partial [Mesorhabditis spiculigera]
MEIYASLARAHMEGFGTTEFELRVRSSQKSCGPCTIRGRSFANPSLVDEVLAARRVADGAAAIVVTTADFARRHDSSRQAARVLGYGLVSGTFEIRAADDVGSHIGRGAAMSAYEGSRSQAEAMWMFYPIGEERRVVCVRCEFIGRRASGQSVRWARRSVVIRSRRLGLAQVFETCHAVACGKRRGDRFTGLESRSQKNGGGLYGIQEAVAAAYMKASGICGSDSVGAATPTRDHYRVSIHGSERVIRAELTYRQTSEQIERIAGFGGQGRALCLFYTGGTTGEPKGVMLRDRSLVANAWACTTAREWPADTTMLLTTPMSHAAGLLVAPGLQRVQLRVAQVVRPGQGCRRNRK